MRFGVRFWPPNTRFDPDVEWLLCHAFGPVETLTEVGSDRRNSLSLADRFGLKARILERLPTQHLQQALPDFAAHWAAHRLAIETGANRLDRLLHAIDEAAQSLRFPYALLDMAALLRHNPAASELRHFTELHVLVAELDWPRLLHAWRDTERTFTTLQSDDARVTLRFDGNGDTVHLHRRLRHVRMIPGGREVDMQQLLDSHRTDRVDGLSDFAHLPGADLLLAHTIARGIAQFGFLPRRFPLMSMLADAIDLEIGENPTRATQALWWVQPDVNFHEVTALREVAKHLMDGDVAGVWSDEGRNGRMLRHLVQCTLDDGYAAGLLPFEAIYRLVELKQDGISTETLANAQRAFGGLFASFGRRPASGANMQPTQFDGLDACKDLFEMLPRAAGMNARQLRALVQLILGTRLL